MKKSLIIIILIFQAGLAFSQNRFSLEGRIFTSVDSSAVEMAAVVIKEMNLWTLSDQKGYFIIKNIPAGSYTFQVSILGYEPVEKTVSISGNRTGFDIYLKQMTLAIDEVVVVAKEGKRMGTSSLMEQTALQHVQPTDLSDVLQLLPGQVTVNPDLSGPKQLSIREINSKYDQMASLGTLLIIDGAPVSNDANLQYSYREGTASFATTVNGGIDVRQVSVDNIESVEVVRGIAGVENGDMLNGAVKVNLKKGSTPFTFKVKVDPGIKQVYMGKGFMLPEGKGSINTDFDYTQSLDDLREKYKTYNRLNGGIGYNNTFFKEKKPLNLNVSLRGSQTIDLYQSDPDMRSYEKYESKDQSINLSASGKWAFNLPFISNLNFNISGNLQHQRGHEIDLESNSAGASPQPISRISGEFVTDYLPPTYISDMTIDGKPYYLNSKLSGTKTFYIGKILNNFMIGTDFKFYGNNGLGRIYDPTRPPSASSSSDDRPRSYKEIPSMKEIAMYTEENLSAPIGSTKLDIQAGLRFSNVQPDGLFSSKVNTTMLDPRINIRYTVLNERDNRNFRSIVFRFGWGIFSKSPTLLHYYPDKAYFDRVSFNYYEPPNAMILITTKVYDDTRNYNLKPAINNKFDGGIDFKFRGVNVNLTGFYEKMINGFSSDRYYDTFIYNKYYYVGSGLTHYYDNGVYYYDPSTGDPVKLNPVPDTVYVNYSYTGNNDQTIKKGIEFTVDLGTVKMLRTSFVLDGAYMKIRKNTVGNYLTQTSLSYMSKPFPLVGVYPGGDGTINTRFNSNLRTITHIKELRMVFTITTQVIWIEKYQNIYNDAGGNPLMYTDTPVGDIYSDVTQIKYINPIGYYDLDLTYHTFDPAIATARPYSDMIKSYNDPRYFVEKTYPPVFQINLRLTKEISDKIDFSFYANNLTNYQPLTKIRGLKESYTRRNQPIYFGAEIRIKI